MQSNRNNSEEGTLAGQRIINTRARAQAGEFSRPLAERGAKVLEIPCIKIVPPDDKEPIADALLAFGEYNWIIFTSPNGVTTFFDYFLKGFHDIRALGNIHIAAVGPGTAAQIQALHLRVDVIPKEHLGVKIAEAIHHYESVENLKILIVRAQVANRDLYEALNELGAIVDDIAIYKTIAETEDTNGASAEFLQQGADWIAFTSASTVEHFHARFDLPKVTRQFPNLKLASIGPETSKAITALGLQPAVEAKQHVIDGLIAAIEKGAKRKT
jgi:uroporphyrinogen III methyltransferase / synthase